MRSFFLFLFLLLNLTIVKAQIIGFEYFMNSDPGIGKASLLTVEQNNSVEGAFTIPLAAMDLGFHRLGVRSKDINGNFSHTLHHSFYIIPATSSQLAGVEYFIDNDPGQGNGTNIPIDLDEGGDLRYVIPLSGLPEGVYLLGIRTKNSIGVWSQTQQHFFFNRIDGELANIVRIEYFYTGEGAPDKIFTHEIAEPSPYVEMDFNADLSELKPNQVYKIHFYAVSEDGKRSSINSKEVNVCGEEPPKADFTYLVKNGKVELTNSSQNYSELDWIFDQNSFSKEEVAFLDFANPGLYNITIIASNFCTADTLHRNIIVPGINKIYPTIGTLQQKESTITITGFGFDSIPSIFLQNQQGLILQPFQIIKADSINIRATFDFKDAEASEYNLKAITFEDQDTLIAKQTFRILEAGNMPFDEWVPFELAAGEVFDGNVLVPETDDLYVFVKKADRIGYDGTWRGEASVKLGEETLATWTRAEDFMFKVNDPVSTVYSLEIKNDRNAPISGLAKLSYAPDWIKLNEWQKGEILRPYGDDWKYFDIGENTDSLFFKTEGYGLWSTLEVYYQDFVNPEKRWVFSNMGAGFAIQGSIAVPKPGRYFLKYRDSAVLLNSENDDQKREYLVYVGAKISIETPNDKKLEIQKVNTTNVGQGLVTLLIDGFGMVGSETIQLKDKNGLVTIPLKQEFVYEEQRYEISFDLTQSDIGEYELEIQNGNSNESIIHPINIEKYKDPDFKINVLTRENLRIGRFQEMQIEITNNSNLDAIGTLLNIELPNHIEWFSDDIENYPPNVGIDLDNFDDLSSWDNVPLDIEAEINGKSRKVIPVIIPHIAPGEKRLINLKIKSDEIGEFTVDFNSDASIITNNDGINRTRMIATKLYAVNCLQSFLSAVVSEAVGTSINSFKSCAGSVANIFTSIPTEFINRTGRERRKNFSWLSIMVVNPANAILNCSKFAVTNAPLVKIGRMAIFAVNSYMTYQNLKEDCAPSNINSFELALYGIGSVTPEDKYGPAGFDQGSDLAIENKKRFIPEGQLFEYKIDYWNKEDATAPAAEVFIRDTLDTNFDINTFNFTEIGFLRWKLPLDGGKYFNVTVDMRPDKNLLVNVEGTLDIDNRVVFWTHRSLDPETMELPEDPMAGYLPPIDSTGYNIGWVNFTISAIDTLGHNTEFKNQAHVNFDGVGPWGPAPPYGPFTNTFDLMAPESHVKSLNSRVLPEFEVQWTGSDEGAGIATYDVFVSKNGEPFELWLSSTIDTSSMFVGDPGNTYSFYSIGKDFAGNQELEKSQFEAITKVVAVLLEISGIETNDPVCSGEDSGVAKILIIDGNFDLEFSLDSLNFQNSGNFEGLSPGEYVVFVRDKSDKEYVVKGSFTINNATAETPPKPILTLQGIDGISTEVKLSSNSLINNQWLRNGEEIPGAIGQSLEITQPGNYQVKVTNEFGCSAVSEAITITNLEEVRKGNTIKLIPNPAEEYVTLKFDKEFFLQTINIVNAQGVSIKTIEIQNMVDEVTLQISALSSGSYILIVEGIGLNERLKMIKK